MLNLAAPTAPEWAARALAHLDEVLVDHAHCEKKAASTAVSLLFRYPEHRWLLEPVSRLAREELGHFDEVLRVLDARGIRFVRQVPSPYARELLAIVRPDEPLRLLDTLLCLALIEARSCERMKVLAEALREPDLAAFYRGLLACEARHHQSYVDLAGAVASGDVVRVRLAAIADHEARVIATTPPAPRLHA